MNIAYKFAKEIIIVVMVRNESEKELNKKSKITRRQFTYTMFDTYTETVDRDTRNRMRDLMYNSSSGLTVQWRSKGNLKLNEKVK